MSTYTMAQIVKFTGISAHKLRIWERRYGFLNPKRTSTNIRYYSDAELRKLINIGILTRNGYRISQIDRLSDEDIYNRVEEVMSNPLGENDDEIAAFTLCMLEMNEFEFNRIFQRNVIRKGLLTTITDVIYPFLQHVAVLWGTQKVNPAQEHFISNLIRQKVISAIESLPTPSKDAPSIVLFLLEEENHELGLLLANFIAKDLGWRVCYLGQNVPLENVSTTLGITKSEVIMTMFTLVKPGKITEYLNRLSDEVDVPILVSGNPKNFSEISGSGKVIHVSEPQSYSSYLVNFSPK